MKPLLFMSTYSLPITYCVYTLTHSLFSLVLLFAPTIYVYLALKGLGHLAPDFIEGVEVIEPETTKQMISLLLSVLPVIPHVPVYVTVPLLLLLYMVYDEPELLISDPYLFLKYRVYKVRVGHVTGYALFETDDEFLLPRVKLYNFYRVGRVIVGVKKREIK